MTGDATDYNEDALVEVHQLQDVFNTGETPELTYTPRLRHDGDGKTYDEYLSSKVRRGTGGVLVYGLSKSGKTSLVERVTPRSSCIWLDGTRLNTIADFWNTIAYRLGLHSSYTTEDHREDRRSESLKGSVGPRSIASLGAESEKTSSDGVKDTWSFQAMTSEQVVDTLASRRTSVVIDDFHHISAELRDEISEAIKPIIRTNFVVIVAIPSHAFDPESASADLGGRVEQLEFPNWTIDELTKIAETGFRELQVIDEDSLLATELARRSFGSPHIMQDLCYSTMESEGIFETGPPKSVAIPEHLDAIVSSAANAVEPFAFKHLLRGRPTKGQPRILIDLKDGGKADIYGITLLAIKEMIPPMELEFRALRAEVNGLATEDVHQSRVVSALTGISEIANEKKGNADPIFVYRQEYAYIQDPILAFFLNYGNWSARAIE